MKRVDKCCGGCNHFKYETTDGSGWCEKGDTKTYCGFGTDCNDFEDVETIRMERVARKGGLNMTKVIVEIDGERHILTKDKGAFELECVKCSLTDKCNRLEAICSIFKEYGGSYHFEREGK